MITMGYPAPGHLGNWFQAATNLQRTDKVKAINSINGMVSSVTHKSEQVMESLVKDGPKPKGCRLSATIVPALLRKSLGCHPAPKKPARQVESTYGRHGYPQA
jgi:hypothetical protein